jgi:arylsulfatase A-like enzyme
LKYGLYGGLAGSLAPALWISGCSKKKDSKRPNIILIVVDTLRADHLSCYGYHRNTTPNIDQLASKGVLFNDAIATAPWTLPSIASIMTSQYPSALGIKKNITAIDNRFPMLAEKLKELNYTTCGIVSHVLVSSNLGFGKGFDYYTEKGVVDHKGSSSAEITNKATSFLQNSQQEPFFLFLHYFDPHYYYLLHEKYNYYPSYMGKIRSGHPILDLWKRRHRLSEDDIKYLVALYDSEIAFTDQYIGQLLSILKKQRFFDNSIIIITADHGEEFMERDWIGHTITLYQELIRVPLIIKFPENTNQIIEHPVSLIDIVPTIYDKLGLQIPYSFDGQSLDLSQKKTIKTRPIFSETFYSLNYGSKPADPIALRALILGQKKLIYDDIKKSKKIYNLSSDPLEQHNLLDQNRKGDKTLTDLLSKWANYMDEKQGQGPVQQGEELLTPEQRKKLETLGYL